MKKLLILLCAAAMVCLGTGSALALTDTATHDVTISVSEVAMLALDDTAALTFTVGAPAVAGDAFVVTAPADATKFLQYTSIVATGLVRTITGQIDVALPTGLEISVAGTDAAGGCGTLGTAAATTALSTTAATVVSGIGSGYTGSTADTNGVQLDYSLTAIDCADAGSIVTGSSTVTVTYTLTEDA